MPAWQSQLQTPPDQRKLCRDERGRLTVCPKSLTAADMSPAFVRAILLGRIAILANRLAQIMPDYTYLFGDSWDPDLGWTNLLSRLQVELELDYTPFTDIAGLVSPISGVYDLLPPPLVVLDEQGNTIPFWNEVPWLWIRVPGTAAGPALRVYAVKDPLLYSPDQDRPENLFHDGAWIDTFETWEGWTDYGSGTCRQLCDGAREGLCMLSKEANCDPNGCYKTVPVSFDRSTTALVLEAWVYRPPTGSDCAYDQIVVVDGNGNGYNIAVDMFNQVLKIIRRDGWRGTQVAQGNLSTSKLGSWYLARLALYPDGKLVAEVFDSDGARIGYLEATDTTYNTFNTVAVLGGRPYRVDTLRLRRIPYQAGVYQPAPDARVVGKQVYVYPIELGEVIQRFTAAIDVDELVSAEYSLDGGNTWTTFTPETVVDIAQYQATSIALRFTVRGEIRAWALLVRTL